MTKFRSTGRKRRGGRRNKRSFKKKFRSGGVAKIAKRTFRREWNKKVEHKNFAFLTDINARVISSNSMLVDNLGNIFRPLEGTLTNERIGQKVFVRYIII